MQSGIGQIGPLAADQPPVEKPCAHGDAADEQAEAVALHLFTIRRGDRERPYTPSNWESAVVMAAGLVC